MLWLHSLKVAQLLRSAACLHTNQSRSYLNRLVHWLGSVCITLVVYCVLQDIRTYCRSYHIIHFELLQELSHLGTVCTCVQDGEETEIEVEGESHTTIDSMVLEPLEATNLDVTVDDVEALIDTNYAGQLSPAVEAAIKAKWGKIMGPDVEIVVSYK